MQVLIEFEIQFGYSEWRQNSTGDDEVANNYMMSIIIIFYNFYETYINISYVSTLQMLWCLH